MTKNNFQSSILTSITKIKLDTAILLIGFEDNKARISEIGGSGFIIMIKLIFIRLVLDLSKLKIHYYSKNILSMIV